MPVCLLHCEENISYLIGNCLKCGPGQVRCGVAAREAADGTARCIVPMRRSQPDHCGDEVDTSGVWDGFSESGKIEGRVG